MTSHLFVLIMALSTSDGNRAGSTSINQEFASYELCRAAGESLSRDAHNRSNYVLTWGCYDTGKPVPQPNSGL